MIRKRIVVAIGVAFLSFFALVFFQKASRPPPYLFDAGSHITVGDIEQAGQPVVFPDWQDGPGAVAGEQPSTGNVMQQLSDPAQENERFFTTINFNTLKFFRFLHHAYATSENTEEHLKKVWEWLKKRLSVADANRILGIYQDYLACEIELATESSQWRPPVNAQEALDLLIRIHEFRRKMLGAELADELFGAEVKSKEYTMRRAMIVKGRERYGAEKEQDLELLNRDMWGEEASAIEQLPKPYTRYREKLDLYAKDFSELSEEEKKLKRNEFREGFFSAETIARLEAVDVQLQQESEIEEQYFQEETTILNNSDFSAEEKEVAIASLQEKTFGDQVESFRRREAIRKGLEALKQKAGTEAQ